MSRARALCIRDSAVNFSCYQRSLPLKLSIRVMTEKDVFDCVYRRHVEILTLKVTCRLIADVRAAHELYFVHSAAEWIYHVNFFNDNAAK